MFLVLLAWKNLWRNPGRTLISMAAIFFAVLLSVVTSSLRQGIFDNLIHNVVSFYSGYIQVHKKGYQEEQLLENSFQTSSELENRIRNQDNVSGITSRLESFALAASENNTRGCLIAGIDPSKEDRVTFLRQKIVEGNYLKTVDASILLSEGLARNLKLQAGDTILLIGQGYHGATAAGKYRISGIARFGSPDLNDRLLFMTLAKAQEFLSAAERVTAIVLSLHDSKKTGTTASALSSTLGGEFEVLSWGEMLPDIKQHIDTDTGNSRYVQGILYMLISFGIFGTLLMMMAEREFELGMLVAIGMSRLRLMWLMLLESLFTVITGCFFGVLVSIPLVYYFRRYPLEIGGETAETYRRFGFEPIFPTAVDWSIFIRQGIIVLFIGLILSLYPVSKVLLLNPVKAMKK